MNFKAIASDILSGFCIVTFVGSAGFLAAHVYELSQRPASCHSAIYVPPTIK